MSRHIVVGDHDVVIDAQGGSVVTIRAGGSPRVTRRVPPVAEPPLPVAEPLGRERELAAIFKALDLGRPVQVLGCGGSGRSTLLRHIARVRGGDRGVVFLSACGLTIDDLLQTLFDACFESDGYRPDPSQMRALMGAVHALLVVDDFDGDADDLMALLDAAPACEIVVASREQTLWSGGFALELGGLAEAAGIALLARELGRNLEMSSATDERADAVELWRAAGGNPLALVQAAAAVRQGAGTLADLRDPRQVAQALAQSLTEPQRQVLGILGLIGAVQAPAALLTILVGSPCEAAVEQLVATGLVTAGRPRITGPLAAHVAALAGTSVAPAQLAEAITAWLAAEPDRWLVAESAPLVLQVLRATMAAGDYRAATLLARAASPRLAGALHLGAWGTLLKLGRSAARAVIAADDEAYFAREAAARLASLGEPAAPGVFETAEAPYTQLIDSPQAAGVVTTAAGTPLAPEAQPPAVARRGIIRKAVAKPAAWVLVIAAAVAGTIAATTFNADDSPQAASMIGSTATPTASTSPSTSGETSVPESTGLTTTSVPMVASASVPASTSASSASTRPTTKTPTPEDRPIPPSECVSLIATLEFTPVMAGDSDMLKYTFNSPSCHPYGLGTWNMSIQGMDSYAFEFWPVSCPDITTTDENAPCTIAITFNPPAPGAFTAEIHIPEAGPAEGHGYSRILLHGHAD